LDFLRKNGNNNFFVSFCSTNPLFYCWVYEKFLEKMQIWNMPGLCTYPVILEFSAEKLSRLRTKINFHNWKKNLNEIPCNLDRYQLFSTHNFCTIHKRTKTNAYSERVDSFLSEYDFSVVIWKIVQNLCD